MITRRAVTAAWRHVCDLYRHSAPRSIAIDRVVPPIMRYPIPRVADPTSDRSR